ncbi:hypothetical protein C1645_741570 [Glomus cerebriforme]|uniref:Uncharacterized protein n=1 Tax=Glomus cerebriforme TaxID=658196 RepID=A0A397SGY1_9GLOM|nr:hypothetical protein C1645_741570 [Glomus cerebriforme]
MAIFFLTMRVISEQVMESSANTEVKNLITAEDINMKEDPPRSLVLNICDDMIHRTCVKTMYKDGTLLCSCGMADNSDPLLPFQYSIVDYGGREKSSILESERPFLVNLRNLGYNILKGLEDKTVRDIDFPLCSKCDNDILMSPFKVFSYLTCRHIFHRLCIKKKLFLGIPSTCLAPGHGKNVDILDQADVFGIISNLVCKKSF